MLSLFQSLTVWYHACLTSQWQDTNKADYKTSTFSFLRMLKIYDTELLLYILYDNLLSNKLIKNLTFFVHKKANLETKAFEQVKLVHP